MGRRLSAISSRRLGERKLGDQVERAKSPDFRACEAQVVNSRKPQDWVAGDAVVIAPISVPNSLQTGIFLGNLANPSPEDTAAMRKARKLQPAPPYPY